MYECRLIVLCVCLMCMIYILKYPCLLLVPIECKYGEYINTNMNSGIQLTKNSNMEVKKRIKKKTRLAFAENNQQYFRIERRKIGCYRLVDAVEIV